MFYSTKWETRENVIRVAAPLG